MKNKKSLLLPLFLLLPAATQCMEQDNSKLIAHNKSHAKQSRKTKQKTIHQLQHERDRLKKKLQEHWDDGVAQKNISLDILTECVYHRLAIVEIQSPFSMSQYWPVLCNIPELKNKDLRQARFKGYSVLGAATLAEKMSFKEKKKLIQHFFKRGCKRPTHKDKKLAFVEKWERCTPSIIKEIYHWCCPAFLPEIPRDLTNDICKLMFWLKFNEKKSLL